MRTGSEIRFHWPGSTLGGCRFWLARGGLAVLSAAVLCAPAHGQTIQTIAGGRTTLDGPDNGYVDGPTAGYSMFNLPMGGAVDALGNLLLADSANGAVRYLDFGAAYTSTVIPGLVTPVALTYDASGSLYVLDQGAGELLRYDRYDSLYQFPEKILTGLSAPTAMAMDADTNLFVVTLGGELQWYQLGQSNQLTKTLSSGMAKPLKQPRGVAIVNKDLVAVSDAGDHRVRFLKRSDGTPALEVGTGKPGFRDGLAGVAMFNQPWQVAAWTNGTLVVADRMNHRVRLVRRDGVVTTLYGIDPSRWEGPCLDCVPPLLPGLYDGLGNAASKAEAREPVGVTIASDGKVYTTEAYYHVVRRVLGVTFPGAGGGSGGDTNTTLAAPVVSPLSGYYPMGVDVKVTKSHQDPTGTAVIYYTLDGSTPTPGASGTRELAATSSASVIHISGQDADLSQLRVRILQEDQWTELVAGTAVTNNTVGIGLAGGEVKVGFRSTPLLPVVVNLVSNQVLQTVQFVVQVAPVGGAKTFAASAKPRIVTLTTNDYAPLKIGARPALGPSFTEVTAGVMKTAVAVLGTNTLGAQNYQALALLGVPIPSGAAAGDKYEVSIRSPSGTDDKGRISLAAGPTVTLVVTANLGYRVGDVSDPSRAQSRWYNAGMFGDAASETYAINNDDVNAVLLASFGIKTPPTFSDAFDAMDVDPADEPGIAGGDGKLGYLDWQILLRRSLGFDTNCVERVLESFGVVPKFCVEGSGQAPSIERSAPAEERLGLTELVTPARLRAVSVANAGQGRVLVPIVLEMSDGARLAGLQFRVRVASQGAAPALTQPLGFVADASLPPPSLLGASAGLPLNETAVYWDMTLNAFSPPLTGRVVLGQVVVQVPNNAPAGSLYQLLLEQVGGALDLETAYTFLVQPGWVAVQAPAPQTPAASFLLTWPTTAGERYTVESAAALNDTAWKEEASDLPGRGRPQQHVIQNATENSRFFRVRRMP